MAIRRVQPRGIKQDPVSSSLQELIDLGLQIFAEERGDKKRAELSDKNSLRYYQSQILGELTKFDNLNTLDDVNQRIKVLENMPIDPLLEENKKYVIQHAKTMRNTFLKKKEIETGYLETYQSLEDINKKAYDAIGSDVSGLKLEEVENALDAIDNIKASYDANLDLFNEDQEEKMEKRNEELTKVATLLSHYKLGDKLDTPGTFEINAPDGVQNLDNADKIFQSIFEGFAATGDVDAALDLIDGMYKASQVEYQKATAKATTKAKQAAIIQSKYTQKNNASLTNDINSLRLQNSRAFFRHKADANTFEDWFAGLLERTGAVKLVSSDADLATYKSSITEEDNLSSMDEFSDFLRIALYTEYDKSQNKRAGGFLQGLGFGENIDAYENIMAIADIEEFRNIGGSQAIDEGLGEQHLGRRNHHYTALLSYIALADLKGSFWMFGGDAPFPTDEEKKMAVTSFMIDLNETFLKQYKFHYGENAFNALPDLYLEAKLANEGETITMPSSGLPSSRRDKLRLDLKEKHTGGLEPKQQTIDQDCMAEITAWIMGGYKGPEPPCSAKL